MNFENYQIVFFDSVLNPQTGKILDMVCVGSDGAVLHMNDLNESINFVKKYEFICGDNIIADDLKYI